MRKRVDIHWPNMATILYRIIKHGLQNFWRQKLLSFATLLIFLLTLLVFEGLTVFNFVADSALKSIQDKIDISVYFKTNAPEDEILRIKGSLEGLSEVKSVEYISRDKALEIFQARHVNDETVTKAISELGENPLSASINIKAKDPQDYKTIAGYLSNSSLSGLMENVSYAQNQPVIDRLTKIIGVSRIAGSLLTIILAIIAIFVAFNTILIAIYSNREEISIMRLVGASNMFIRGPYMVEGVMYGVVAAVISIVIMAPVIYFMSPYVKVFIPGTDLSQYFTSNVLGILGSQLIFGAFIGIVSSFIAVRRYLSV